MARKFYKREDLVGKDVIDFEAKKLGVVKDIAFNDEGKLAFTVIRKTLEGVEEEVFIPMDRIYKLWDVVLLKSEPTPAPFPPSMPSEKICSKCSYRNKPDARFCVKCGSSLEPAPVSVGNDINRLLQKLEERYN